jgi:hypothetical protein
MTDMYGPSTALAARRKTALAARVQLEALAAGRLSLDIARPELLKLGRDLAKACRARAAAADLRAQIVAQPQPRRDLALALAQTLEERRLKGHELIMVGLRLIAPDERRQFVEAAMQRVDDLEQRPAGPAA